MTCSNIAFIVLLLGVVQQVTFAQTLEEQECIQKNAQLPKCFSDGTLERQQALVVATPLPETCEPATMETYLTTILYGESLKCLEELIQTIDVVLNECVKTPADRVTYKQGIQQLKALNAPASFCALLPNCATECVPAAEKVAAAAAAATTPPTQGGPTLAPQSSGADATTIGLIVGGSVLAAVVGSVLVVAMNNKQASYVMAPASPSKMMSGPPQIQLPPGWNSATDPVNGRTYYYNQQGHTQWTIPM